VAVLVLLLLAAVVGVLAVLSWPAALPGALSPSSSVVWLHGLPSGPP
jgi:hypothetical protein